MYVRALLFRKKNSPNYLSDISIDNTVRPQKVYSWVSYYRGASIIKSVGKIAGHLAYLIPTALN